MYVRACYGQECTIILATDAVRLPACGGLRLRPASRRRSRCRSDIAMANRNAALRRSRSEARRRHESHASPVRHERRRVDGAHANCVAFYGCAGGLAGRVALRGRGCVGGPYSARRPADARSASDTTTSHDVTSSTDPACPPARPPLRASARRAAGRLVHDSTSHALRTWSSDVCMHAAAVNTRSRDHAP